jgi:hypothetical protein
MTRVIAPFLGVWTIGQLMDRHLVDPADRKAVFSEPIAPRIALNACREPRHEC